MLWESMWVGKTVRNQSQKKGIYVKEKKQNPIKVKQI